MVRRISLVMLAATAAFAGGKFAMAEGPATSKVAEKHPSDQLAVWIDARFEELWKAAGIEQKEVVDDSTYLRRVYLDLVGTIPSVAQTRDFLADTKSDKRQRIVEQLVTEPRSSAHLSRVWRRIMIPGGSPGVMFGVQLEPWLQQQFSA